MPTQNDIAPALDRNAGWGMDEELCWIHTGTSREDWLAHNLAITDEPTRHWCALLPATVPLERARPSNDLTALDERIEASTRILWMSIDPEDEHSPKYSRAVWHRATQFLRDSAKLYLDLTGRPFDLPGIDPGPDGSIDLHWNKSKYELLINIPELASSPADFYGDDRGNTKFKGTFDTSRPQVALMLWLSERI